MRKLEQGQALVCPGNKRRASQVGTVDERDGGHRFSPPPRKGWGEKVPTPQQNTRGWGLQGKKKGDTGVRTERRTRRFRQTWGGKKSQEDLSNHLVKPVKTHR